MGHQINYYMMPSDTERFERELRSKLPVALIHSQSPNERPRVLDSLAGEAARSWRSFFLARPDDLVDIILEHVPSQGYWSLDIIKSPAIEFGTCFYDGQILGRSRVYYVDGFYGSNDDWVTKPEEFRTWAKRVFAIVRKHLKKHEDERVGVDALAWLQAAGGELDDGFRWARQRSSSAPALGSSPDRVERKKP